VKCPICDHSKLVEGQLNNGPNAQLCPECEGAWIVALDYRNWQNEVCSKKKPGPIAKAKFKDVKVAKKCPNDGSVLSRYRVGSELDVWLDQCPLCFGIWFDKGEWKSLADRSLHLELNKYFTEVWQRKIEEEESRKRRQERFEEKWGKGHFKRIRKMHKWLLDHPDRDAIISFLKAKDPYSDQ